MRIIIPTVSQYKHRVAVEPLLSVLEPAWNYHGLVELELAGCNFISAEAVAILAGLAHYRNSRKSPIALDIASIDTKVFRNLRKMGFSELFDHQECISHENSIPLYHDNGQNLDGVISYMKHQVMSRSQMPQMAPALHKEIRKSFVEIFGNIARHSDSPIGGAGLWTNLSKPERNSIDIFRFWSWNLQESKIQLP